MLLGTVLPYFFLQLKSNRLKMCACPAAQIANARQVRIPPRQQNPNQSISGVIDLVSNQSRDILIRSFQMTYLHADCKAWRPRHAVAANKDNVR
jgi:hypothetical protein